MLNAADSLRLGALPGNRHNAAIAIRTVDGEAFSVVFEVLTGKRNPALALCRW